jgi:hypothetical protein
MKKEKCDQLTQLTEICNGMFDAANLDIKDRMLATGAIFAGILYKAKKEDWDEITDDMVEIIDSAKDHFEELNEN